MMTNQDQKIIGPPRPRPTPKLPNDPVVTLMKLNASAKFDEEPERPVQLRLDPQRAQVRVVARRDVLGCDRSVRHDLLLLPPRRGARD